MSADFKPMLAGKAPQDVRALRYPALVSPKLDGVRAVIRDGRVLSRNLLELPCQSVQELFGDTRFDGFDGELIVGDPTASDAFRKTTSVVMSDAQTREPIVFHVFDDFSHNGGFDLRFKQLKARVLRASRTIKVVPHFLAVNHHALQLFEEEFIKSGYEGLMIRDKLGAYKHGRSTTREGGLLKLKRFEDDEAVILECKELQRNVNADRTGGLAQRRSSKRAGRVGGATLGAFHVQNAQGITFDVGTGFSASERARFWDARERLRGKIIKYRYFPTGSKEKPRFPTFQGFRHILDL